MLERVATHVTRLPEPTRERAEGFVQLCRDVLMASPGEPPLEADVLAARRTEIRLGSELFARGGARTMPLGALGRAALARIGGAPRDAMALLSECGVKLQMFGS